MRVLALALIFVVCLGVEAGAVDNVYTLQARIDAALSPGDSREKVETFLASTTWLYSYDRFANRFQALTRDGESECTGRNLFLWALYDCKIQIILNLDDDGHYKGRSVEQSYSGL